MAKATHYTPDGYRSVIPYLSVKGADEAIAFYKDVFGATEVMRFDHQGKIGHAELKIGDSHIMLADEFPDMDVRSPKSIGGTPVSIMVYVPDVDATVAKALKAGATVQHPIADKFYGDRSGSVVDPFGHVWHISTHIEDVDIEEMHRRAKAANA